MRYELTLGALLTLPTLAHAQKVWESGGVWQTRFQTTQTGYRCLASTSRQDDAGKAATIGFGTQTGHDSRSPMLLILQDENHQRMAGKRWAVQADNRLLDN